MSSKHQTSQLRLLILAPIDPQRDTQSEDVALTRASTAPMFSTFLKALTNSSPSEDLTTFAGYTSHPPLSLDTKYYSASVSLWCDELPPASTKNIEQSSDDLLQWKDQMLSAEAAEVRDVVGGIVVLMPFNAASVVSKPLDSAARIELDLQYINAINQLREVIEDETGRDVAAVAVVQDVTPIATLERSSPHNQEQALLTFAQQLEDACISDHGILGWDVIPWQAGKSTPQGDRKRSADSAPLANTKNAVASVDTDRNEFGEKTGIPRVIEVLEQTNWLSSTSTEREHPVGYDLVSTDDFLLDDNDNFGMPTIEPKINRNNRNVKNPIMAHSDEFQAEIIDLHFALHDQNRLQDDDGEDIQVEQLTGLMERVVAIREAASEISGPDREAFAKREVGKIMREMNI